MKIITLTLAATLMAGTALAQTAPQTRPTTPGNTAPGATSNAPMPGVSPSTGTTPATGVVERNSGTAAASGDRNQAVATTGANAPHPARGANSFTQAEARRRIERSGYGNVGPLTKDGGGVWRGMASKDGQSTHVWLDYKGNIGRDDGTTPTPASASTSTPGQRSSATPARNVDGTTGNPPGTAATRSMDRTLGTNTTGTNPAANMPDGTPGNPPGTAAGRTVDRALGTNNSGANPTGSNAATPR